MAPPLSVASLWVKLDDYILNLLISDPEYITAPFNA